MNVDPTQTALIVIDIQNGFCHPDGSLYAPGSEAVIEPICSLIERVREQTIPVIFTRDVHPPEQFANNYYYDEFDRWGEHVIEGSWDAQLHDALPVADDDTIVDKHTYDAFHQTSLAGYLDSHGIHDLLFVGTLANVCVLHTAGSAGLRDYRPILISEGIGCLEDAHKDYALEHADWLFGEVIAADDLSFEGP